MRLHFSVLLAFVFASVQVSTALPPEAERAARAGVNFLVKNQNPNGSWGSPTRTKGINIYAPVPGAHHAFRMGSTCLCLSALISFEPTFPQCSTSIEHAEKWLSTALPQLKRANANALYNTWGHAYALRALAQLASRTTKEEKRALYRALAQAQYEALLRYEMVGAGWGYFNFNAYGNLTTRQPSGSSHSFVTATVLSAIAAAQEHLELKIDAARHTLAVHSLLRQRLPDGAYLYGDYLRNYPRIGINRPAGSLARTPAAHAALLSAAPQEVTAPEIKRWAQRFIDRHGFLISSKKRPLPHEGPFALSGYFYYYGHYYLSQSLLSLPSTQRAPYQSSLLALLLAGQERGGAWWDYPLYDYHKYYGTGYALTALKNLTQ